MTVSGPTGGVVAGRTLSRLIDAPNLVTLDMGGTSTDCATIINGEERFTTDFEIEWGLPIQVPMIDVRTIGAGGGSIAWSDKGGLLQVGPQGAGANPAPACYGMGGTGSSFSTRNLAIVPAEPVLTSWKDFITSIKPITSPTATASPSDLYGASSGDGRR